MLPTPYLPGDDNEDQRVFRDPNDVRDDLKKIRLGNNNVVA